MHCAGYFPRLFTLFFLRYFHDPPWSSHPLNAMTLPMDDRGDDGGRFGASSRGEGRGGGRGTRPNNEGGRGGGGGGRGSDKNTVVE